MVNSKKMSKSTIAVIALSILLVLSLILTATGAWFTDHDSKNSPADAKTFGKVDIALDDLEGGTWVNTYYETDGTVAVPGIQFTADTPELTNSSNVHVYVYVTISNLAVTFKTAAEVTNSQAGVTYNAVTANFIDAIQAPVVADANDGNKVEISEGSGEYYAGMYLLADDETIEFEPATVTIAKTLSNTYQLGNVSISYNLEVRAIQAANITAAEAYYALTHGTWTGADVQPATQA